MSVIERAQQEARDRYLSRAEMALTASAVRNARTDAFERGATFAATITAEQIEAAARAILPGTRWWEASRPDGGPSWAEEQRREQQRARRQARVAFIAAGFEVTR